MNELLQKHGCSNVFSLPEGLKELMCDITREVLREQPEKIFDFIANYLSVLLITREHGVLAMKILEDLCDCKPSVSEHLMHLGMERKQADELAQIIKEEIEGFEPIPGKEKVKETLIVKRILNRSVLDEDMTARVCQITRNAYREYWYRKKLLEKSMKVEPDEPWEIAAQHTLELYKKTNPSFGELTRATIKIQAAYRGYYIRRNLLGHLKPKPQRKSPKKDIFGPPADIAGEREIDLGPVIDIKVREDDVNAMFDEYAGEKLGLHYDPMKTITHVEEAEHLYDATAPQHSKVLGGQASESKSLLEVKSATSRIRKTSQDAGTRQSRQMSEQSVRSQSLTSTHSQAHSMQKISFLQAPPEVIPDINYEDETAADDTKPIPETIAEDQEPKEVQEELAGEQAEVAEAVEAAEAPEVAEEPQPAEGETAQEVPEDLPADDVTDNEEGASAPTISAPSSAPVTADNTDVEDGTPMDTGDEEEGE